jgi:hypothetical protein
MPSLGLLLLSFEPVFISVGSFMADFMTETHIFNPNWPPHAKFHSGQTISFAFVLGVASLYYTWRTPSLPTTVAKVESLFTAALFGSMFSVTGLSAILYPGSLGVDPEFGTGFPQLWIFGIPLIVNWIGYWLEKRRVETEAEGGKKKT